MIRPLAIAASLACLGFAPMPFVPKKLPPAPPLEGLWEIVSDSQGPVKGRPGVAFIRIEPGRWTFLSRLRGEVRVTSEFHLKAVPGPLVKVELRRNGPDPRAYGKGVLEITGDQMRLSYGWGVASPHPTSLGPPGAGTYNYTLRRAKEPPK
jgi:hypothetical protein